MRFDVQLWDGNGWKLGGQTIATVEAADLDGAQQQALELVGAIICEPMQSAYDEGLDGVHERRIVAQDVDPRHLSYGGTERDFYADEGGNRLTITAWPNLPMEHAQARTDLVHWTDREALDAAFAALRAEGFDAREALDDCSSCAWAAAKDGPVVFYNEYSRDNAFGDEEEFRSVDILHDLSIGCGIKGSNDTVAERALCMRVMQAFEHEGLRVKWDGNPNRGMDVEGLQRRFDLGYGDFYRQRREALGQAS
jgi:hypothetical protein